MKKILVLFGTRPEAIKMCPLVLELKSRPELETIVCVTGQHREMLDQVLQAFKVSPDYDLSIMHAQQSLFDITSNILMGIETVLTEVEPDLVLVHGDTSTTFVCALAEHNLFRAYGQVYTVISDGVIHTVSSMAEARLTNENEAYPEENDSFLRQNYGAFKLARLSKLPINFVKDAHFDLERYLQTDFARSFGKAEERILMNGEGGKEPKGLLATAEVGIRHARQQAIWPMILSLSSSH